MPLKTGIISKQECKDIICYLLLILMFYGGLYLSVGSEFLPGHSAWAVFIIWLGAHIGGYLITKIKLPPLLGMLLAGLVLRNLPGNIVTDLKPSWSKEIRTLSLAIVFLRVGLELNLKELRKHGWAAVRLLLIPGIIEALVSGAVAIPVFHMPASLAFSLGFILKAVGPAIVIAIMAQIKAQGLLAPKGIADLLVAAASFDDLIAIALYTLVISFAVRAEGDSVGYGAAKGPLSVVLGLVGGILGGTFCSWTKVWDTQLKRALVTLLTAILLIFLLEHFEFTGGSLAALATGMTAKVLWSGNLAARQPARPHRRWLQAGLDWVSKGPNASVAPDLEVTVGYFWRIVAEPMLFGLIGAAIDFRTLEAGTIPRSVLIIMSGWLVRFVLSYMVLGNKFTVREKLFITVAWSPKATVQAALAAAPLDLIRAANKGPEWEAWGEQILTTSVFAILICGFLGVFLVALMAPRTLPRQPPPSVVPMTALSLPVPSEPLPTHAQPVDDNHGSKGPADGIGRLNGSAAGHGPNANEGVSKTHPPAGEEQC